MFIVPNARSCIVSYRDTDGITHSAEVVAESLLEAAALGVKALRIDSWCNDGPGTVSELTVEVVPPRTRHTVPMQRLSSWLYRDGPSPREQVVKTRLRQLLAEEDSPP